MRLLATLQNQSSTFLDFVVSNSWLLGLGLLSCSLYFRENVVQETTSYLKGSQVLLGKLSGNIARKQLTD